MAPMLASAGEGGGGRGWIPEGPLVGLEGHRGKWWHTQDDAIKALIRRVAPATWRSEIDADTAPAAVEALPGAAAPDAAATTRPAVARPVPTHRRSVHFEDGVGDGGDALDALMRRAGFEGKRGAADGDVAAEEHGAGFEGGACAGDMTEGEGRGPRQRWSDSKLQLQEKVVALATQPDSRLQPSGAMSAAKTLARAGAALSADSAAGARPADERRITVKICVADSYAFNLHVSPDLRVGPPKPPPGNAFADVFGHGGGAKCFELPVKSFEYRARALRCPQRATCCPEWSDSLKGMISESTGIAISSLRLAYRGTPMSVAEMTLRSYGVADGEIVDVVAAHHALIAVAGRRHESNTSSAQLLTERTAPAPHHAALVPRTGCEGNDVGLKTGWVAEASPRRGAPVGIVLNSKGGHA